MVRPIVVLIAIATFLAAGCSSSPNGYGPDAEAALLRTCALGGQPQDFCQCLYDQIAQKIPFDKYVEFDKQMRDDPNAVPDELIPIVSQCAASENSSGGPR